METYRNIRNQMIAFWNNTHLRQNQKHLKAFED